METQSKKKKVIWVVASLALVVGLYFIYDHLMFVETDNAQVEAPTVMLAPKISGYIREVQIKEGQKVKKDEVLIRIDNRDYQSAYDSAKSEMLSLEARKNDSEKNYHRLKELYGKAVVSSQQYDSAVASYNEIRARYDSASARMIQAQLNVENTQIKAPSDGIIARKSAEVGQLASPGAPLVGFVGSETRWITANFKETDIENVKVGKKVNIKIDAISGKTFQGEVESISSATGATFTLLPPDNATGNFTKVVQRVPVKIKFSDLEMADYEKIQTGLSALVKVHIH